jgi:hypothetical protein
MTGMELQMYGEPARGESRMAYVGGRGYGKTAAAQAYIQTQSGEMVPLGVVDSDFSFGPVGADGGKLLATNYTTQLQFELDYAITQEQMKAMYHAMTFRRGVLGDFSMEYTPAEELRDRLNDRLRGKEPLEPINTRYWRKL